MLNLRKKSLPKYFPFILVLFSFLPAGYIGADDAVPSKVIPLEENSPGIGFDDLRFSQSLNKVLVPGGRTGKLFLIDPADQTVETIGGFSVSAKYWGGHDFGITSVDEGKGFLFTVDRTSKKLSVIDPAQKKIISSVALSGDPDYVRFVPSTEEVWVTEPDQAQIEIFKLADSQLRPTGFIDVAGGPESLAMDPSQNLAYTHLWKGKTISLDLTARQILKDWPNYCRGSRGIALDETLGFLMAACAEGGISVMAPGLDGRLLSRSSAAPGVDVISYNPTSSHVYTVSSDSGILTIFLLSREGQLSVLKTRTTERGAHCVVNDHNHIWVCDPAHGQIIYFNEEFLK